jgi:hypothetical protein
MQGYREGEGKRVDDEGSKGPRPWAPGTEAGIDGFGWTVEGSRLMHSYGLDIFETANMILCVKELFAHDVLPKELAVHLNGQKNELAWIPLLVF